MPQYFKTVNLKQGDAFYDEQSDASVGIHRIEFVNEIAKAVVNLPAAERKNLDVEFKVGSLWKYENNARKYAMLVAGFRGSVKEEPYFIIEIREVG